MPNVNRIGETTNQADGSDQSDQVPPHPLPHHPPPQPPQSPQAAEAYWPENTQLVHPVRGGKWLLLAQNNTIQAVVQDAIPLVFRHTASVNSFPSGADKVKLVRDSLYQAATAEGFNEVTDRLPRDQNFGRWLSSLVSTYLLIPYLSHPTYLQVDARVSILRGDVRDAASAAVASFRITDPDEANEYLLQDLTYIYPVDPFVSLNPSTLCPTAYTHLPVTNDAERPTLPPSGH